MSVRAATLKTWGYGDYRVLSLWRRLRTAINFLLQTGHAHDREGERAIPAVHMAVWPRPGPQMAEPLQLEDVEDDEVGNGEPEQSMAARDRAIKR
jgi:hypothetical protein